MAGTPKEIEMEADVSIDMENNSITKRRIAKEEDEDDDDDDDDDDLSFNIYPLFASIKASEKMEDPATEIERPATEIEMKAEDPAREIERPEIERPATELIQKKDPATEIEKAAHFAIDIKYNISSISAMLETLSPQPSECCIYRVPSRLSIVNWEAYRPHLISIGPFHHGRGLLKNMEEYKLRHLKAFLVRTERNLEYFLKTVHEWEQRARDFYSESIHLSSDQFVKMILVDGSFIVEFLLREYLSDPIFDTPRMFEMVFSDMMLLESQLPFFVLDGFFNDCHTEFGVQLLDIVHFCCRRTSLQLPGRISPRDDIKHLVDYMHRTYVSSIPESQLVPSNSKSHFVDFLRGYLRLSIQKVEQKRRGKYERSPTATQLHQAGIKFKKGTSTSLFGITFSEKNGILEIPQLIIDDLTRTWFQNLIAFEQCHRVQKCIFSDYFSLLDGMIDTSKDVDLLIHGEIITNKLSSSKEVSILFNRICKDVFISDDFYFSDLCQDLNGYCKSPWHMWIATLRRDYFSTPWAVISVIAAVVLIVLTFIQSICSIISL